MYKWSSCWNWFANIFYRQMQIVDTLNQLLYGSKWLQTRDQRPCYWCEWPTLQLTVITSCLSVTSRSPTVSVASQTVWCPLINGFRVAVVLHSLLHLLPSRLHRNQPDLGCPRVPMSGRPSTVVLVRRLPACLSLQTAPSPVIWFTNVRRSTCTQYVWWTVLCYCRSAGVELLADRTATMWLSWAI